MDNKDEFADIGERLRKIERILEQLVESVERAQARYYQEKDKPIAVNAIVTEPKEIVRDRTAAHDKAQRTQGFIAAAAWAAFFAALAYAAVATSQLGEMREQTAAVYRQFEIENANASAENAQLFRQLDIARQQATAAQDSVAAIQRQMREDQRAWIKMEISDPKIVYTAGQPFIVHFQVENIGKTAATHLVAEMIVEKLPANSKSSLSFRNGIARNSFTTGVSFPNTPMPLIGQWLKLAASNTTEPIILSSTDMQELTDGASYFVIYGRTKYDDIFGIHHISNYCMFNAPATKLVRVRSENCTAYNSVDNN